MATAYQGFLIPAALTITCIMLATPTVAVRSSLLNSLLNNKGSENNRPLVLVLDNSVLSKGQLSNNLDSDLLDLNQRNNKAVPYVYLQNQPAQSKNSESKFRYPSRQRGRIGRFQKRNKVHNMHSQHHEGLNSRNRNNHRDDNSNRVSSLDNDYEYRGRGERYQREKQRNRSNRHLRTDDRRGQDQDREQHQNHVQESAQAQIPVLKSLLRTLSCTARDECQDICDTKQNGHTKHECEDRCEKKFEECEQESEEVDCGDGNGSGNSCEATTEETETAATGSTKGPPTDPPEPYCKRC